MEDYSVVEELGRGSYGLVTLVRHEVTQKQLVQKRIDLTTCSMRVKRGAQLEVKLLSTMRHPNIVRYRDSVEVNGVLHILMEYCENGDLQSKIRAQSGELFEESQILNWFVQVCMALQYLHEHNILHRDLKTQNIFLTRNNIIKVGDFGIARILDSSGDMATTLVGTPVYMSPEVLTNKPYNYKSDIWSLGCCLVELCTLKTAFMAKDLTSLLQKIVKGRVPTIPSQYSSEISKLCKYALHSKPEKRPSTSKILRHPFIRQHVLLFLRSTSTTLNANLSVAKSISLVRGRSMESIGVHNCQLQGKLPYLNHGSQVELSYDINDNEGVMPKSKRKKSLLPFRAPFSRDSSQESFASDSGSTERASSAPNRGSARRWRIRERNVLSASPASDESRRFGIRNSDADSGVINHDLEGLVRELNRTLLLDNDNVSTKKKCTKSKQMSPRQQQAELIQKECNQRLSPAVQSKAMDLMQTLDGEDLEVKLGSKALLYLLGSDFHNYAPLLIQLKAYQHG